MAKKVLVMALAVILASCVYLGISPKGSAVDPVKFYVYPAKIEDVALTPNTTFNVSVKVDNVPADPGLAGIQFNVTWDPAILTGVSMQEIVFHEVTPVDNWDNIWQLANKVTVNSVAYTYTWQDMSAATAAGYAPINGSHTVANITLKVVGTGKSTIGFTVDKLGNPNGDAIDHVVQNATFSNVGAPPPPEPALLYVDPAEISNGSLGSGTTFAVNIKIVNASDVAGLEFKLGFNASALNVQSVAKGALIPVSVMPVIQIDNSTGFARFNVSLSTPLNGDGTVAIVQFQVMADGVRNSALHLYDVALVDSGGEALPLTTVDGTFSNLGTHDVAVTQITPSETAFVGDMIGFLGDMIEVNVTAANVGDFSETFNVKLFYNATQIGSTAVNNLGAGLQQVSTFHWNTTGLAIGSYNLTATADTVPGETNTADNARVYPTLIKLVLRGDLKHDGIVDVYDAIFFSNAFGSVPGDPNWNPEADMDGKGQIDIIDIILLAMRFGSTA